MNCNKELIQINQTDETNDIYPCKTYKCTGFHKSDNKISALSDAIYWLKPTRVSELLDNLTLEELEEELSTNILNKTIGYLSSTCGVGTGILSVRKIGVYGFSNRGSIGKYSNQDGSDLFLRIIELVCSRFPQLINSNSYTLAHTYNIIPLKKILNKYYVSDDPNATVCIGCGSTAPEQLIPIPCACGQAQSNQHIHLSCLVEQVEKSGDTCPTCSTSYGSHTCPRGRINFPKLNIYKSPLMSYWIFVGPADKVKQLELACAYLIPDQVKDILSKFKKSEFKKLTSSIGNFHPFFVTMPDQTEIFGLSPNPPTNLPSQMYPLEHIAISKLLIMKCIEFMDLACEHNVKLSWGKYLWCGNTSSPGGSGFTLTNSSCTV